MFKRKSLISILCLSAFLIGCGNNSSDDKDPGIESSTPEYTLAILPDTQKYSRYSPERFWAQTEWIANNYQKQNIVFTAHLGDVVDLPLNDSEWDNARQAFDYMESNPETPYSVLAGNHDILAYQTAGVSTNDNYDTDRDLEAEPYLKNFHPNRLSSIFSTIKGSDSTGFNTYHLFKGGDRDYLVLALDWRTSDATLDWAQTILDQYPNTPTILTTHQLINIDENLSPIFTIEMGVPLWDNLIKDNDQIFMTFNGHHHGEAIMNAKNKYGRDVFLVLVDYQSGFWGGNGMMQLVTFAEDDNKIKFRSFSPWVDAIPEEDRDPQDQLERWIFDIDFDFEERFSNLNNDATSKEPGAIDGVLAYWIFDKEHQITEPFTNTQDSKLTFKDLSGNGNTLTSKAKGTPTSSQGEHLTLIDETADFGYAKGALHLNNSNGEDGYYLSTTSPIIDDGILDTYTIEAIVRITEDWNSSTNAWGAILSHFPSGTQTIEYHGVCPEGQSCNKDEAALSLNVSSLKEFQWISTSKNGLGPDNWSWEVDDNYWYHIAITNDGEKVQFYVDGSLTMRTGEVEQHGLLTIPGGEWAVGVASWQGNPGNVFRGDVSEIRISDRVLEPQEWLINQ